MSLPKNNRGLDEGGEHSTYESGSSKQADQESDVRAQMNGDDTGTVDGRMRITTGPETEEGKRRRGKDDLLVKLRMMDLLDSMSNDQLIQDILDNIEQIDILVARIDELDDIKTRLDGAEGDDLDDIGKDLGLSRNEGESDDDYKKRLIQAAQDEQDAAKSELQKRLDMLKKQLAELEARRADMEEDWRQRRDKAQDTIELAEDILRRIKTDPDDTATILAMLPPEVAADLGPDASLDDIETAVEAHRDDAQADLDAVDAEEATFEATIEAAEEIIVSTTEALDNFEVDTEEDFSMGFGSGNSGGAGLVTGSTSLVSQQANFNAQAQPQTSPLHSQGTPAPDVVRAPS